MKTLVFLLIVFWVLYKIKKAKSNKKEKQQTENQNLPVGGDAIPADKTEPEATEIQKLHYFCIKDKGYYVSVLPKDQGMQNLDYIEFDIAGLSYRGDLGDYMGEHVGTLEPEPNNPYDANAIKILAEDGYHVGYVPKDMTEAVREFASLPCTCYFYIGENDGTYYSDAYINR